MLDIKEQVPLAPLTTFQIGGPAAYFVPARSNIEVFTAFEFAKEKDLKVFILGGGSNVLINDKGFEGLVIKVELKGLEIVEDEADTKILIAGAGESWEKVVERACTEELWGIENLSGIPGTVGGAVVQNIGAYGAALSEVLKWAEVLDTLTGEVIRYTNEECRFDYRDSVFKKNSDLVVLRAAFKLSLTPKPNISYKDLAALFSTTASLTAIREAVIRIRKGKFPDLMLEGTAGSFFKNPILPASEASALKEKYPDMPLFTIPETDGVKVPLAWLLDNVLHMKGASIGGARLFEKQPLVIAAARNTLSTEVKALAQKVKNEVKEKFNLHIEEEVKIL